MATCRFCGEKGARTMIALGYAHKRCIPERKIGRNSIAKIISHEARRKYPLKPQANQGTQE